MNNEIVLLVVRIPEQPDFRISRTPPPEAIPTVFRIPPVPIQRVQIHVFPISELHNADTIRSEHFPVLANIFIEMRISNKPSTSLAPHTPVPDGRERDRDGGRRRSRHLNIPACADAWKTRFYFADGLPSFFKCSIKIKNSFFTTKKHECSGWINSIRSSVSTHTTYPYKSHPRFSILGNIVLHKEEIDRNGLPCLTEKEK